MPYWEYPVAINLESSCKELLIKSLFYRTLRVFTLLYSNINALLDSDLESWLSWSQFIASIIIFACTNLEEMEPRS